MEDTGERRARPPLYNPPARTPAGGRGHGGGLLFPFQQLKPQDKDVDRIFFFSLFHHIMAANNVSRCVRFGDGTPPLCHASNLPQGQVCQWCDNEHRSARDIYEGSGPEARRALLLKENQNLRLVSTFASFELEAEARCTEAWQQAVRAKISERDMLVQQRDQAE